MHLSMYCPTTPPPPPPPLGRKWGFTGGIDTKLLPHYGAFDDRSVSAQIFFVVTSFAMSNPELIPRCNWGQWWGFDTIGLPCYGAFDIRLCQIPTIAPYIGGSEGGPRGAVPPLALPLPPLDSQYYIDTRNWNHSHCIQKYRKPMGK